LPGNYGEPTSETLLCRRSWCHQRVRDLPARSTSLKDPDITSVGAISRIADEEEGAMPKNRARPVLSKVDRLAPRCATRFQ
jgi:hypothetical protein